MKTVRGLTLHEGRELLHRLQECEKAAEWYKGTPRELEERDTIYLYETVALLGRMLIAGLTEVSQ